MSKKSLVSAKIKNKKTAIFAIALLALLPFFSVAGDKNSLFVDDNASGMMDGSSTNPYKTIKEALKHADDDTEIHVLPGTYEENIEIPAGVEIFGSSKDKVTIKADDEDEPVVKMKDGSKINKVTIKDGERGIVVTGDEKASIIECIIKDNKKDGIKIEAGETKESKSVSITDSEIFNNGDAGIFSEKRRVVLMENEIRDNESDGVALSAGVSAWIEDNNIKDNDGSGMKAVLDGSQIFTKDNRFANNEREGIEIDAFGGLGRIDINKSKVIDNGRWAIARVQRKNFAASVWNGLTIQSSVEFWGNAFGNITPVIWILN